MATITLTKATSRGQVTLPKFWRDKFKTNQYIMKAGDFKVEFTPVRDRILAAYYDILNHRWAHLDKKKLKGEERRRSCYI